MLSPVIHPESIVIFVIHTSNNLTDGSITKFATKKRRTHMVESNSEGAFLHILVTKVNSQRRLTFESKIWLLWL